MFLWQRRSAIEVATTVFPTTAPAPCFGSQRVLWCVVWGLVVSRVGSCGVSCGVSWRLVWGLVVSCVASRRKKSSNTAASAIQVVILGEIACG